MPSTWERVPLSSITEGASQRIPSANERITYIDIGSVDRNSKAIVAPQRLSGANAPSRARKQVMHGDTLVSMTRPNLNAVALVPAELDGEIASTGFDVLRPLEGIDPRWIAYLVRTKAFVEAMSSVVQGALYPAVRSKDVRAYDVPLAPSAEQTRIADQLDKLLARIQACNDRLDAIPALLKRFRQAVVAAGATGNITSDWRNDTENIQFPWQQVRVSDAGRVQLGRQRAPKYHSGEHMRPYLRVQNVFEARLDLSDVMEMDFPPEDFEKYRLYPGDILLNEGQSPEYLGRPAIYRGELPGACFTNTLIRFQPHSHVVSEFALIVFRHQMHTGRYIREGKITTNIAHLGANRFSNVEFPLPTIEEQAEIVRRVDALFKLADRIEARYTATQAQAQRLTPLLLDKAFRGELVPQDNNDESAAALLERIRTIRAEHSVKPKIRTRRRAQHQAEVIMLNPTQIARDHLTAILRRQKGLRLDAKDLWRESQLDIPDFYEQLKREADEGLLREVKQETRSFLEAV